MDAENTAFRPDPFQVEPVPHGARRRRRVFLYSHDTFGLGHLRRNLAIAEQLLRPEHDCEVWLVSGSPVLRRWDLPAGLWVQPLPPVVKTGAEQYAPRSDAGPFSLVKGYREALILRAVMRERPDVILVDHAPAGMKNELVSTLAAVRQELPRTRIILGLRDIIDSPDVIRAHWRSEGIYDLLEHAYDEILVYGTPGLFDAAEAYALTAAVAQKIHYTGYVARPPARPVDAPWPGLEAAPGIRVLVTAGGGGDGHAMMAAYLDALAALPARATASLLVPGPLMPAEQAEGLRKAATARPDVAFLSYTTDLVKLLGQAEAVVTMGGYNTTAEILAARKPAIIVPRAAPRAEQRMRAELLERLSVVSVAEEGPDLASRLAALLPTVLTQSATRQPDWDAIDLDGARRAAEVITGSICPPAPWHVMEPSAEPATRAASPSGAQPEGRRVAYILKRYPRLSETFILNEIRAMEQLGEALEIFSLLPPEPPPHHPTVALVRARVTHLPPTWSAWLKGLARGHGAALAAAPKAYLRTALYALGISVRSRQPFSVWRHFLRAGFLVTEARRHGVTHIHAHFANAPTAVAHMLSAMTGLSFSFTTHAKDLYLTPPIRIIGRVRAARFVTTCTRYNVDYLRDMLSPEDHAKVNLVYHGIDLSRFRYRVPTYAFATDARPALLLCVARLVPKKGLDDLIAACAALSAQGIGFRCRIVGAGPLRDELAAAISAHGLADMVTLDGAMTHDTLIDLFSEADLFALAPRITDDGDRDGIPNVIVEAMATGVPVVSTEVSGIPELVEHERTGLLVPPNDPVALAAAIARLLGDAALGKRLAGAARARLDRCFDCWQNTRSLRRLVDGLACEAVAPDSVRATPPAPRPIPATA